MKDLKQFIRTVFIATVLGAMFGFLWYSIVCAATYREIKTGTGQALVNQKGQPLANVPVTFTLTDKYKKPADCWTQDGYRVAPVPVTVKTNAFGQFSTSLAATSQCVNGDRYYLCHVESPYAGIADFIAALDVDTDWITFLANGGVLTPTGNTTPRVLYASPSAGTLTVNLSQYDAVELTPSGDFTLAFANVPPVGVARYLRIHIEPSTDINITWPTATPIGGVAATTVMASGKNYDYVWEIFSSLSRYSIAGTEGY